MWPGCSLLLLPTAFICPVSRLALPADPLMSSRAPWCSRRHVSLCRVPIAMAFSLLPPPPSHLFYHTLLPPCLTPRHDWVWHSHKPWRLPAGHCLFSCRRAHKKKDHPQMQPHKHFREEKLEHFQFSAEKCHIITKQTWLGVSSASPSTMYHFHGTSGPQLVYPWYSDWQNCHVDPQ